MSDSSKNSIHLPLDLQNLLYISAVVLCYFIGLGLGHYLGQSIDWEMTIAGLSYVLLLFLSGSLFGQFFDTTGRLKREKENKQGKSEREVRQTRFTSGMITLTVSCVFAYLIILRGSRSSETITLLFLLLVLELINVIPPFRLISRGYGELVMVVWIANLVPALAFVTQENTIHTLLPVLTFPLTAFFLATVLATSLEGYLNDMVTGRRSLVIMLGWKLAMNAYSWLILIGYLFIAAASLIRLPWSLTWPLLLPAPIFLITSHEISRIKNGIKPRWALLSITGFAGLGCMLYVLLVALWV